MSDYIDDDNLWKEDLFGTLGVAQDATDKQIKKAYLKLAKKYHPDKFLDDSGEEKLDAQRKFSKISVAYNTLIEPNKKQHYLELRRLLADHLPDDQKVQGPSYKDIETSISKEQSNVQSPSPSPEPVKKESVKSKEDQAIKTDQVKEEQANFFYNKGVSWMKKKKKKNYLENAIDNFKEAIKIKTDKADYHTQLGLAYLEKNWTGMAHSEFKQSLKYNPHDRIAKKHLPQDKAKSTIKKGSKTPEKKGLFQSLFGGFGKKK